MYVLLSILNYFQDHLISNLQYSVPLFILMLDLFIVYCKYSNNNSFIIDNVVVKYIFVFIFVVDLTQLIMFCTFYLIISSLSADWFKSM